MNTGATDQPDLAASFGHPGVATAYQHRPPYPPEVFDVLVQLITERPRTVLDLGAGEGALARPLAGLVDRVDALDVSPAMVEAGRRRPGGGHPNLRWIVGAAETARWPARTRWSPPAPACTGCPCLGRCRGWRPR